MKNSLTAIFLACLVALACASGPKGLRSVSKSADVSQALTPEEVTRDTAGKILKKYTVDFTIPNPLNVDDDTRSRRFDPSHKGTIECTAVLLDEVSTEADIFNRCRSDSLDEEACRVFRGDYAAKNLREGMFRIRITMESGFSERSIDPKHWALYIENADGVMIEPADITVSPMRTVTDSVYSKYYKLNFRRNVMKRDITLYFSTRTFFGQDILGGGTPFIVLVISRQKRTLARVAWELFKVKKP